MRRRTKVLWLAAAATAALAIFAPEEPERGASVSGSGAGMSDPASRSTPAGSASAHFKLPERETLREPAGDMFESRSWRPPVASAPPPRPAPPPLPYRFAGALRVDGALRILLAKEDRLVEVKAGDALEDGYRVESVTDDSITLVYTPLKAKTTIEFTSPLASAAEPQEAPQKNSRAVPPVQATAPAETASAAHPVQGAGQRLATLSWEGPASVRVGSHFDITLRITSEQPVSVSPIQLSFDPAVLQSVGVRPGRLYASERGFSYRVKADGSILIGATNRSAAPATDAELLVLTFRPLRPNAVAQVNIASLSLQGAEGHAIVHEQLAAFRTAIGW